MDKVKTALLVAVMVSIGFLIPDVIRGTFDRADVAVPLVAFISAFLAQVRP